MQIFSVSNFLLYEITQSLINFHQSHSFNYFYHDGLLHSSFLMMNNMRVKSHLCIHKGRSRYFLFHNLKCNFSFLRQFLFAYFQKSRQKMLHKLLTTILNPQSLLKARTESSLKPIGDLCLGLVEKIIFCRVDSIATFLLSSL